MNYSKIIKTVTGIMAFIGFFLLMGIAGTCDFLDITHQGWSIIPMMFKTLIAILLMLPFVFTQNLGKEEDNERNHTI